MAYDFSKHDAVLDRETKMFARVERAVLAGGGKLLSVQYTMNGNPVVIFTSPITDNTLSELLYSCESAMVMSPDFSDAEFCTRVKLKIEADQVKHNDRTVSVKASVLNNFSVRLQNLDHEIHELLRRKS